MAHKQYDCIHEGGQDCKLLVAIREFPVGFYHGHPYREKRYKETENVTEIVSGVRKQPYGTGNEAYRSLYPDE